MPAGGQAMKRKSTFDARSGSWWLVVIGGRRTVETPAIIVPLKTSRQAWFDSIVRSGFGASFDGLSHQDEPKSVGNGDPPEHLYDWMRTPKVRTTGFS
jgi:hypothetical protein